MMISVYHHDVRTTLTLDDDVAAKLKAAQRKSDRSFRDTVNHFLRIGLNARLVLTPPARFVVRPHSLGPRAGVSYDNVWDLIAELDEIERP